MQSFRKLSGNIFFKIILGFVALSFILFGISGVFTGSADSWVAKIGNKKISYRTFVEAMKKDHSIILAMDKGEEATKYLDSEQFKSDVLRRLINKSMVENLRNEFGISAGKKTILGSIAKDKNFQKENGKFDYEKFKNFLTKSGLNEEHYVNEVANEITMAIVIQSIGLVAPSDHYSVSEFEKFNQEKRLADIVTISHKNVKNIAPISLEEAQKFYSENIKNYDLPEIRKASYLKFSEKNFLTDLEVSEQEVFAEYERSKDQMKTPQTRDFYHVVFGKEEEAKNFVKKLDEAAQGNKTKLKIEFVKIAKELAKKDLKAISLTKISQRDLLPQIADLAFKLELNEKSGIVQSPIGFHIFLLNQINQPQEIDFEKVKKSIHQKLIQVKKENVLQEKISAIDDLLLTSNSLIEVAKKFNLKVSSAPITIDSFGKNENGQEVNEINNLDGFVKNTFALKKGQTSKIFYIRNSSEFYAIKLEEIIPSHSRQFSELKNQIFADLKKEKEREALFALAKSVEKETTESPDAIVKIAAKHQLKLEKNQSFLRSNLKLNNDSTFSYKNKFLQELFNLKTSQSTSANYTEEGQFIIGILREIKNSSPNSEQIDQAQKRAQQIFVSDVMQEFSAYLLGKYPIKINEKIFGKQEESQNN